MHRLTRSFGIIVVVSGFLTAPSAAQTPGDDRALIVRSSLVALDQRLPRGGQRIVDFSEPAGGLAVAQTANTIAGTIRASAGEAKDHLKCEPPDAIEQKCRLEGTSVLIKPSAPEIKGSRATISVMWYWSEGDGLASHRMVEYDLTKEGSAWKVIREDVIYF